MCSSRPQCSRKRREVGVICKPTTVSGSHLEVDVKKKLPMLSKATSSGRKLQVDNGKWQPSWSGRKKKIARAGPGGRLYLEGRFNGRFFALQVWGAYIWRGLYMEGLIFGILRYATGVTSLAEPSRLSQVSTVRFSNLSKICPVPCELAWVLK